MLLDSNILIYSAEPSYDELREFLATIKSVVSIVSKVEVLGYHQLSAENKDDLEQLFASLKIIYLSDIVIDKAIELRQKKKMTLGDSLIAATAISQDLSLVTANDSDFNWIDELEIINPLNG